MTIPQLTVCQMTVATTFQIKHANPQSSDAERLINLNSPISRTTKTLRRNILAASNTQAYITKQVSQHILMMIGAKLSFVRKEGPRQSPN